MSKNTQIENTSLIYQGNNGEIILRGDIELDTIWANQGQIAEVFGIDRTVVSRHIKNIFNDSELDKDVVCAKFAHTTQHGAIKEKTQTKDVTYYNLDIILAVGYRTNSSKAISFRRWANSVLKDYITQGYSLNPRFIQNTQKFQEALTYLNALSRENIKMLETSDVLSLIQGYAQTWLNLDTFDKGVFPSTGFSQSDIEISGEELTESIAELRKELIKKGEATDIFAQEKTPGSITGIIGNVFQTFDGIDVYSSLEEKAAHLLYFLVKNHPFTDGNKRSGALSFLWFLQKSGYPYTTRITPEVLTTLTILTAESDPKEKDKIIGLILLLLA